MRSSGGWVHNCGDVISSWLGLSFVALCLAAVVGVGFVAHHVHWQELTAQRVVSAKPSVYWLAQHLSHFSAADQEALQREIRRASRSQGIAFGALVCQDGTILAHSQPEQVGQRAPAIAWAEGPPSMVRHGRIQEPENFTVLCSRVPWASGEGAGAEAWIGLELPKHVGISSWSQSTLFFWSGYILLAVLGIFLIAYRTFRKSIQPLAVIQRRLLGCDEQLAERVVALRLNDSFDQVSASWNRLIEFVGEMQEQVRKSNLRTDITVAMDGYRSERLTNILMQIPFGVLVVDSGENISFANRALSGMLSTTGETLEGRPIGEVLDEPLRMTLLSANGCGSGLQSGSPRNLRHAASRWTDHTFQRLHGELTLRFWKVPGDTGEHILFVQDVTQAKEAERARDQFLYHVTHELRTPLTNIRAYAETLSQGVIDDEQTIRECYNVIMGETQRLNRLVEDILNVSQLEVGTARLDVGEVQLDRLMRTVVQDMQGSADARNIDLVLSLPPKMPQVRGDKERLAVVLTNLVGNAIKYTPEGGRVDVRCLLEDSRVRISVTDSGIGIQPEDQERIFEKFYRVSDERVSGIPGTGLGLAIVKETIRLHGGAVFVESTPGQGSTFTVSLPAMMLEDGPSKGPGMIQGEKK